MLNLYQKSKTFGQRPSNFLNLHNDWIAYQFDNAIFIYGNTVLNRWEETDKKGRKLYTSITDCMGYSTEELRAQKENDLRKKLEAAKAKGRAIRKAIGRKV